MKLLVLDWLWNSLRIVIDQHTHAMVCTTGIIKCRSSLQKDTTGNCNLYFSTYPQRDIFNNYDFVSAYLLHYLCAASPHGPTDAIGWKKVPDDPKSQIQPAADIGLYCRHNCRHGRFWKETKTEQWGFYQAQQEDRPSSSVAGKERQCVNRAGRWRLGAHHR